MPIYRTKTGLYVGTQAEAGKGFKTIELPKDKAETLALLNAAHEHGYDAARFVSTGQPPPTAAPVKHPDPQQALVDQAQELDMGYQHMTAGNILRRMDATLAANKGAGAIAEYVGTAPPEEVALVAAAVAMRLKGAGEAPLPKGQVLDQGEG